MHGTEMFVLWANAYDLVDNFDGIRVLGVKTSYESVSLTSFNHHHAKVVAFKHLVVSFLEGVSLSLTLLGQNACIAFAAVLFGRVAQVDNLYAVNIQV